MIVDYQYFVNQEKHYWQELRMMIDRLDENLEERLSVAEVERLYYLYQRAASALPQLKAFPLMESDSRMLEQLVARAYSEIHVTQSNRRKFSFWQWISKTFPRTFRAHIGAFKLTLLLTVLGMLFGAFALIVDTNSKRILLPFYHLQGDPSDRVAYEETERETDRLADSKGSFSAYLMTHNIKVSIFSLALGITWGIGTLILLFYNGIILGAICFDYIIAGEGVFLCGWLLPHGSIEIPAILIGSQAGLIIAGALIGKGSMVSIKDRFRNISGAVVTLIAGAGCLLVWAGIVEAFFSQYHAPALPYSVKITFGVIQLAGLIAFLNLAGREKDQL